MKRWILAALFLVASSCNAFVDEDSVGPTDTNVIPGNNGGNVSPNNVAPNNVSPNNIAPNNVSPLNNIIACPDVEACGFCLDERTAIACVEEMGCLYPDEIECQDDDFCAQGECIPDQIDCPRECTPTEPMCRANARFDACVTFRQGMCAVLLEYDCDPGACLDSPARCNFDTVPCDPSNDVPRCSDPMTRWICDQGVWAAESCGTGETCEPGLGECVILD